MKIYTMVKIDMDTGETLAEESFEYNGPLVLAIGGASATGRNVSKNQMDSGKSDGMGDVNPRDKDAFENLMNHTKKLIDDAKYDGQMDAGTIAAERSMGGATPFENDLLKNEQSPPTVTEIPNEISLFEIGGGEFQVGGSLRVEIDGTSKVDKMGVGFKIPLK